MSSPTEKTSTSDDRENDNELNLTKKKVYLPLAIAGGLGGVCNTGIQFVIPNRYENDLLPNVELSIAFEFLIYLSFSIIVSSILAPAFAIFTVGFPSIKNFNRLLIISMLSGAFLTLTVETAQQSMFASKEINELRKDKVALKNQVKKKEKQVEKTEEITKEVVDKLDNVSPNSQNNQLIKLNILELKVDTVYEFAKVSNEKEVIDSKIDELRKVKKEIESINPTKQEKNKKDELIKKTDNHIEILEERLKDKSEERLKDKNISENSR